MSRDLREVIRDEPLVRDRVVNLLRNDGPLTVVEVAARLGAPQDEVMVWMMGLRKYGHIAEEKAGAGDDRYRYGAVGRP